MFMILKWEFKFLSITSEKSGKILLLKWLDGIILDNSFYTLPLTFKEVSTNSIGFCGKTMPHKKSISKPWFWFKNKNTISKPYIIKNR